MPQVSTLTAPEVVRSISIVSGFILLAVTLLPHRTHCLSDTLLRLGQAAFAVAVIYASYDLFHQPPLVRPVLTMMATVLTTTGAVIAYRERRAEKRRSLS